MMRREVIQVVRRKVDEAIAEIEEGTYENALIILDEIAKIFDLLILVENLESALKSVTHGERDFVNIHLRHYTAELEKMLQGVKS